MRSMVMELGLIFGLFGTFVSAKFSQGSFFPEVRVAMAITEPAKKTVASQKVATNVLYDLDFKLSSSAVKESPHDLIFEQDIMTLVVSDPPTEAPSEAPSVSPTFAPSAAPSDAPSAVPSVAPSVPPTFAPSAAPSDAPSVAPSVPPTFAPSAAPSVATSVPPTFASSAAPSVAPSVPPTFAPSAAPSVPPSASPTATPSVEPSPRPTASPSFTASPTTFAPSANGAQIATIALSQSVVGVTLSQWNANADANCAIFALTVAAVSNGQVTSSQVGSCTVANARRLRRALLDLLANAINVGYTISVPASTDVSTVASSITTSITSAVSSGSFTKTMNSVAINNSASLNYTSPLTVAASDSVTVDSISIVGAQSHHHTKLTSGQIAGIVIGVLVGSFCLAMGCYAFIVYGRSYWSNNAENERREFAVKNGLSDDENLYAASEGLAVLPPSPVPLIENAPAPAPGDENTLFVSQEDGEVLYSKPHGKHEVVVVRDNKTTQL